MISKTKLPSKTHTLLSIKAMCNPHYRYPNGIKKRGYQTNTNWYISSLENVNLCTLSQVKSKTNVMSFQPLSIQPLTVGIWHVVLHLPLVDLQQLCTDTYLIIFSFPNIFPEFYCCTWPIQITYLQLSSALTKGIQTEPKSLFFWHIRSFEMNLKKQLPSAVTGTTFKPSKVNCSFKFAISLLLSCTQCTKTVHARRRKVQSFQQLWLWKAPLNQHIP